MCVTISVIVLGHMLALTDDEATKYLGQPGMLIIAALPSMLITSAVFCLIMAVPFSLWVLYGKGIGSAAFAMCSLAVLAGLRALLWAAHAKGQFD